MASSFNAFSSAGLSAGAVRDVVQSLTGINVKDYGATGDARKVTDAVINGTTTVTSATAAFTSADVGKSVWGVETATGLKRLAQTTITAVNSATSITVASAAVGSYSNIWLVFGTDDTLALQTAYAAAKEAKSHLIVPAGGYIFSALPFDGNLSTVGRATGIIGAGMDVTTFYPAPSYNLGSTTSNTGIFLRYNGNCREAYCAGFAVDGHYNDLGASGYHIFSDSGNNLTLKDIRVAYTKGVSSQFGSTGTRVLVERCIFEASSFLGISIGGGSISIQDSYTGNHAYWGLYISGLNGSANTGIYFRWLNGIVDECGGASCYISGSTDVVFIGARCFGPVSLYAVELASSSHARFVGCELVGFGSSGNRGGLKVASGCIATLTSCRLHGLGTLYGLDNAGTVYDGGGNVSNNKTGAGTISVPAL